MSLFFNTVFTNESPNVVNRLIIFVIVVLCFAVGNSQNRDDFCLKLYKVNILLQKNHYTPKAINNQLSEYLFDNFLEQLDSDHSVFLKHEVDSLKFYRHQLDNAIFNTDCQFINDFISFYTNGLKRNLRLLDELKTEKFNPEINDTIRFLTEKTTYYSEPEEIKNLFRKRIVYEVLDEVARMEGDKDSLYALLPEIAGEKALKYIGNFECRLQNQLHPNPDLESYVFDLYINIFCSYFDPHTNFFSADSKSEFFNSISSSNLTFGLEMETSDAHQVRIQDIHSGSPAFREPLLEKGDQLLRVKHQDDTYEVNCSNISVIQNFFFSDSYKDLVFTFRKKTGVEYQIALAKELVKNYENTSYSFLIEGKKKIGYIHIPSFYSNVEGSASNLLNDILIEYAHLRAQGAKGYIFDLQFNGGGDMYEAFKVISLFIDEGPFAVFDNRRMGKTVISNFRKRRAIKDPMVVLINGYTASAGELFAYSLQDHNRAIILGQRSYGKATMQTFFPMDDADEDTELLKITIEKMYRLTGKSHQNNGVIPDIVTPAFLEPLYLREGDLATAVEDKELTIDFRKKTKFTKKQSRAIANANQRIKDREYFKEIQQLNKIVAQRVKENDTIPLRFDAVLQSIEKEKKLFSAFNSIYEYTFGIEINYLDKDQLLFRNNNTLKMIFENKRNRA
ncbi:MAG TPA: S41 family peptidase, partial [Flavobacteriaceae bacterium]|nr:S41 family peptidase [Flavobacteriaceae bacterium]